uniref:Uroplakin 3A n=1 Tax=Cairina moschata TaxID=8855 RepID=A0A8C3CBC6_CAIMO
SFWDWSLQGSGMCGCCVVLKPQLGDAQLATNNPTLTTVSLEKPFCMFDSSLYPNRSYTIYLYVMKESASAMSSLVTDDSNKPLGSTFQQTSRGQLRPYNAAFFDVPDCAVPPRLADVRSFVHASYVLKQYLFRVGDDGTCLYDPNFLGVCNPPLAPDTTYRFKYVLVDNSEGMVKDQTLWSDPIKTRRAKLPMKIDTCVLVFLLLTGFLASVFFAVMRSEDASAETKGTSPTVQQSESRPQLSSE